MLYKKVEEVVRFVMSCYKKLYVKSRVVRTSFRQFGMVETRVSPNSQNNQQLTIFLTFAFGRR